jgi:pyrroline-5-carboxylate reductase
MSVGFVGVGTIASAVASAILQGPHAANTDVVLSPRSASHSGALAARYRRAKIAASNQAVVDTSDVVFVGVLPTQVTEVCAGLTFRSEQVVVGLAAGWPPSRLAEFVEPTAAVCQLIPLPMITLGVGPVVLYPGVAEVRNLLAGCGSVVVPEREEDIGVLSCASAVMSSYFAFQNAVIGWAIERGLGGTTAAEYVTALLFGLAAESAAMDSASLSDAVRRHETPGGLNEQIRRALEERGQLTELVRQLELVHSERFPRAPSRSD